MALASAPAGLPENSQALRLYKYWHKQKNWLFSWSEVGARHIGVIQSLLVTCRLHEVNPYTYLVDVLQRISQHPASRVDELVPRVWKEKFADDPLVSNLHRVSQ